MYKHIYKYFKYLYAFVFMQVYLPKKKKKFVPPHQKSWFRPWRPSKFTVASRIISETSIWGRQLAKLRKDLSRILIV